MTEIDINEKGSGAYSSIIRYCVPPPFQKRSIDEPLSGFWIYWRAGAQVIAGAAASSLRLLEKRPTAYTNAELPLYSPATHLSGGGSVPVFYKVGIAEKYISERLP